MPKSNAKFCVGDMVGHDEYGLGAVVEIKKLSDEKRLVEVKQLFNEKRSYFFIELEDSKLNLGYNEKNNWRFVSDSEVRAYRELGRQQEEAVRELERQWEEEAKKQREEAAREAKKQREEAAREAKKQREEAARDRLKDNHQEFLKNKGIENRENIGLRKSISPKRVRVTHCYNCKTELDNRIQDECSACEWIVCECGACGCLFSQS